MLAAGCSSSGRQAAPEPSGVSTVPTATEPDSTAAASTTTSVATDEAPRSLPGADQRDDFGDPIGGPTPFPPDKQQLIDALGPPQDCPSATPNTNEVAGSDQTVLQIVTTLNGCLSIERRVVASADVAKVTAAETAQPDVISVGPASHASIDSSAAADPQTPQQQWWLTDLSVDRLDQLSVDPAAPRVRVAVIDSGIDDTNPDIAGHVVARYPVPPGSAPFSVPHGSHVAGIIGATAGNRFGGRGVAQHVDFLDATFTYGATPAELISWSVVNGAQVINMSFCENTSLTPDGPCDITPNPATLATIAYARSKGVLLFASAGNCGPIEYVIDTKCGKVINRVEYPAAYPGVMGVGSYNSDGTVSGFSNRNDFVDVSAPGDPILSTSLGRATEVLFGTSQATPMVAGAAAAILAHRPDIVPGRVFTGLMLFVRDAGPIGWDSAYGNGRIAPAEVARRIDKGTPLPVASPDQYPLIQGATGDLVTQLQTNLTSAGYDLGEPDGSFGARTTAAVSAYQSDQALPLTGTADEQLFNSIATQAGQAPPCTAAAVQGSATLQARWAWQADVLCGPGWAVATAFVAESPASEQYLLRVRGPAWVVVNTALMRIATTLLAQGTPLSSSRFSALFGGPGWPGRVGSADDVAKFVMFDALNQSGTIPDASDLADMWLDNNAMHVWLAWMTRQDPASATIDPCVLVPDSGELEGDGAFAGTTTWRCRYHETAIGEQIDVVVDEALTMAGFVGVDLDGPGG